MEHAVKTLMIGGDLAPKSHTCAQMTWVESQRAFLRDRLRVHLEGMQPDVQVFLIMGNDDCIINQDVVMEGEQMGFYQVVHGRRAPINGDFDVVGYSCTPLSPIRIKDWEKHDLRNCPTQWREAYRRRMEEVSLRGCISGRDSVSGEYHVYGGQQIDPAEVATSSIQRDLASPVFTSNPQRTVYLMHAPPYGTNLDMVWNGEHVGSFAQRLFILRHQPYLTLHGHIHEAVRRSGDFRQRIGETLSLSSGNTDRGPDLALVEFDLYDPGSARRVVI